MCGRFVVARASSDLVAEFDIDRVADSLPEPSFNIAPTQSVAVIIDAINRGAASGAGPDAPPVIRRLESAKWGLIPGWATDPAVGSKMFNARIETAAEKPSFRAAVAKRRAAIPASGYYEWQTAADGTKTPMYIHAPDDEIVLLAGLYEWWKRPDAADDDPTRWVLSTSILTRDAVGHLAPIHDRMPVFLEPGLLEDWLDPEAPGGPELLGAVSEAAADLSEDLEFYRVGPRVGSVHNNSPELILPA